MKNRNKLVGKSYIVCFMKNLNMIRIMTWVICVAVLEQQYSQQLISHERTNFVIILQLDHEQSFFSASITLILNLFYFPNTHSTELPCMNLNLKLVVLLIHCTHPLPEKPWVLSFSQVPTTNSFTFNRESVRFYM
jgi:hypothetical protein